MARATYVAWVAIADAEDMVDTIAEDTEDTSRLQWIFYEVVL